MTLEEKYKKTNDSTYNDRILKAIRQNLNKYKFKTQEEILIFLEKKINHLSFYNTNAKDTYQVMPTLITPIFGYEDRENVIIDIPQGTSTYVQYSLVRENEFFVTSKQALTTLIEMKHRFLNTYPKEN